MFVVWKIRADGTRTKHAQFSILSQAIVLASILKGSGYRTAITEEKPQ